MINYHLLPGLSISRLLSVQNQPSWNITFIHSLLRLWKSKFITFSQILFSVHIPSPTKHPSKWPSQSIGIFYSLHIQLATKTIRFSLRNVWSRIMFQGLPRVFPGSSRVFPVVKTLTSTAGGMGSIPGQRTKILHAAESKSKQINKNKKF